MPTPTTDPIVRSWLVDTYETLARVPASERAGFVEELIAESPGWLATSPERLAAFASEARALLVPCSECGGSGHVTALADVWRWGGHMTEEFIAPCECVAGVAMGMR
jgi:hypothetical protein